MRSALPISPSSALSLGRRLCCARVSSSKRRFGLSRDDAPRPLSSTTVAAAAAAVKNDGGTAKSSSSSSSGSGSGRGDNDDKKRNKKKKKTAAASGDKGEQGKEDLFPLLSDYSSFSFDPSLPAAPLLRMTPPLYSYLLRHTREPPHLLRLREQTAKFAGPRARNAVSPEAGAFLRFLVASLGATRALEVGVFTGYSSAAIASALPPASRGGLLLALEKDPKPLRLARRCWEEAGVADRVEARVGDAREELAKLVAAKAASDEREEAGKAKAKAGGGGGAGGAAAASETDSSPFPLFDFAFIDADKKGYLSYFESCLKLVRKGGVIAIDNVLWYGRVAEEEEAKGGEEEEEEESEQEEKGGGSEEEKQGGAETTEGPPAAFSSLEERFPSSEERLAPAPRSVRREQQRLKKKRDRRWAASQLAATEAVRELNARLLKDERIDLSIIPVGDGIALCRKL